MEKMTRRVDLSPFIIDSRGVMVALSQNAKWCEDVSSLLMLGFVREGQLGRSLSLHEVASSRLEVLKNRCVDKAHLTAENSGNAMI